MNSSCISDALECGGGVLRKLHGEPVGAEIMPELLSRFCSGTPNFGSFYRARGRPLSSRENAREPARSRGR
jgi:hypothetical protein